MIIPCPKCQKKNRIPDRPRTDGHYSCKISTCGTLLLHHTVDFHDKLIRDVIIDLKRIKENLQSIKFAIFQQKDIDSLRRDYEKSHSRLQNWYDNVQYIRDPIERQQIYGTYKKELRLIKEEVVVIVDLVNRNEEIKRVVRRVKSLSSVFSILNVTLRLAISALGAIGIYMPEIQLMSGDSPTSLIEGGLDE
jgi:dynactin complex subunit